MWATDPDGNQWEVFVVKPWVFQIARNLMVDYRRAQMDPTRGADLPDPYQQAVRLFELEGVPQQEIADRLGLSLSGAKSRVQRGRDRLRALLFDCCTFERDRRGNVIGVERNAATGPLRPDGCTGTSDPRH